MRKEDVPQHGGISGPWKAVCYAVDGEGRYVLAPSSGWDPVNRANGQAWEEIAQELGAVRERVLSGEASPLEYHMVRRQMDPTLLARYVGLSRWRVRRHLRPSALGSLGPELLARYAAALGVGVEELGRLPEPEEGS